jgi:tetratricopeptide (TPR) repeat protein
MKATIIIILTAFSITAFGQTNYEKFKKLYQDNDTIKIKALLNEWEKINPNDPELYTSAFNFHYSNSKQEILSIQKEDPKKESLKLTDSTGKFAGYLTSNLGYNEDKLERAFDYINKGIAKFPDRLDIRFGKIYVLAQIGDYKTFTNEIIKTVERSAINKNNWLWTENKKKQDGQKFLLENVQAYLKQLYDTEDDNLLANMIQVGEATLKYYPGNIEILSTTAVAFMLTKRYDKAIEYLKQAEKINPQDYIVLNNIAQGYKMKGDKENAIKYYRLTEKYGDEQAKQEAIGNIEKLEK